MTMESIGSDEMVNRSACRSLVDWIGLSIGQGRNLMSVRMADEKTFASITGNQGQWCELRRPRIDELMKGVNIRKPKYMSNKSLLPLLRHLASRTGLETWRKTSQQSPVGFGLETDRFGSEEIVHHRM
jgi:hypothetical protein